MRPAIRVDNLSKCYRVADRKRSGRNLSESFAAGARAAWDKVRQLADPSATMAGTHEFWALKDVSFEIPEGEVVGIIGRNGAGKSTLLKVLSRIVEPTSGGAEIHGRVGSLLEVGTGFHPELTGRENVYLNGAVLGMSRKEIDRKFDAIVDFAGVDEFLDTPVKRYSSGMGVRLGFAVAAHLEPDILIVDEVLAVGDAAFQQKCLRKIQDIAAEGRTVCVVSHNVQVTAKLCSCAILLESGQLKAAGSIESVMREYAHTPECDSGSIAEAIRSNSVGTGIGAIQSFELRGSDKVERYAFDAQDEMQVAIGIRPGVRVDAARIGIGVNNPLGERTFACASYLAGYDLPRLTGGTIVTIRFLLPSLVPGRYTVDVSVMDDTNSEIHGIYPVAAIEILDRQNRIRSTETQPRHFGHVIVPSKWSAARED